MTAAYIAEPPGEHITGVRESDLTTRSGQERYLVDNLGITYPQAKAFIRAWLLDCRDEERLGNDECLPEHVFWQRLQVAAPFDLGRKPTTRKWQVGEGGGWGTRS